METSYESEIGGEPGMAALNRFVGYAEEQEVKLHPFLQPYHAPGHGLAIHATGVIEANKVLVHVPSSALLAPSSIPSSFCSTNARKSLSVHGLLAAYIAFDKAFTRQDGKHTAWKATWPSFDDFRGSMPLLWPEACRRKWNVILSEGLQLNNEAWSDRSVNGSQQNDHNTTLLPPSAVEMVHAQAIKYQQDFERTITLVLSAKAAYQQCPQVAEDGFRYAWCVVNTRSLYFRPSSFLDQAEGLRPASATDVQSADSSRRLKLHGEDDSMVLCPLIDFFNHTSSSDSACKVTYDTLGFTVTSQKPCSGMEDEEIFVSYGPHTNDFLLAEYGFLIPGSENMRDSISLDSVILPSLTQAHVRTLDAKGYLGEYTLFSAQANGGETCVCWRTEIVAWVGILSVEQWEGLVDGSVEADELGRDNENKARLAIRGWVGELMQMAERSISVLIKICDDDQQMMRSFGDDNRQQQKKGNDSASIGASTRKSWNTRPPKKELSLAKRRHQLVLERWKQMVEICHSFLGPDGPE